QESSRRQGPRQESRRFQTGNRQGSSTQGRRQGTGQEARRNHREVHQDPDHQRTGRVHRPQPQAGQRGDRRTHRHHRPSYREEGRGGIHPSRADEDQDGQKACPQGPQGCQSLYRGRNGFQGKARQHQRQDPRAQEAQGHGQLSLAPGKAPVYRGFFMSAEGDSGVQRPLPSSTSKSFPASMGSKLSSRSAMARSLYSAAGTAPHTGRGQALSPRWRTMWWTCNWATTLPSAATLSLSPENTSISTSDSWQDSSRSGARASRAS